MDIHRINLKFFLKDGPQIPPETWFRVFNTWIPDTPDEVLIDTADYSHVPAGPVTLLVGHEANTSIDNTDRRLGLLYSRKQPLSGGLFERLGAAFAAALGACRRLEEDPSFEGRVRFRGDEILLQMNDRLLAPNTQETLAAIGPDLKALLDALYAGADVTLHRKPDPRERFALDIRAEGTWDISALLKNIERLHAPVL